MAAALKHLRTVYENSRLIPWDRNEDCPDGYTGIPVRAFNELQSRIQEHVDEEKRWLRHARGPRRTPAIQVLGHAGVLRTSDGTQIEVLPKIGQNLDDEDCRFALVEMLKALLGFRWYESQNANLQQHRMPLMEIFIREFLMATRTVVRRGLRSHYISRQDNLMALRGRLLVSRNIRENLVRPDRFFTEHDEFSTNRPENRLLHAALKFVLSQSRSPTNQQLARELGFVFDEIPISTDVDSDFGKVRPDRGMHYYQRALQWAELILKGYSPLTHSGNQNAPSLMFPMADLFEAYVEKILRKNLAKGCHLTSQTKQRFLVSHKDQHWMQLKPDLMITTPEGKKTVLDTKWKMLDASKSSSRDKYGISQGDFYQLYAYGHYYSKEDGDLILIYPKTECFSEPLEEFVFIEPSERPFKLWVLPFHLPTLEDRKGYLITSGESGDIAHQECSDFC